MKCKGIYIWGVGFNSQRLNQIYSNELTRENICGYIDNDPKKWGKIMFGHMVYEPKVLEEEEDVAIYISINKRDEVIDQIKTNYPHYYERILEKNYFKKQKLISRYQDCSESEVQEIIGYLRENPLDVFNYSFVSKYKTDDVYVGYEKGFYFTIRNGKKLYFSKDYDTEQKVKEYYQSLLLEQDEGSPHRYLTEAFDVPDGAVVIDAGVAEGNFTLDIIDRAKRVYLFEPDPNWVEALQQTFEPYDNKVKIICKGVSDYCDNTTTTIDSTVEEETVDFIKMDIEGEEYYALNGAKNIIMRSENVRVAVCTYHQEFAYDAIRNKLQEYGFNITHSYGYMWYIEHFNMMRPPVLRRGLIRAERN